MTFDPGFEETLQVIQIAQTGVDDSGSGEIVIQNLGGQVVTPGQYWLVEVETFKTDSVGLLPSFELYAATEDFVQLRDFGQAILNDDGLSSENSSNSTEPIRFWPQEQLIVRFAGGDPGFTAGVYLQVRVTAPKSGGAGEGAEAVKPFEPGTTPAPEAWG